MGLGSFGTLAFLGQKARPMYGTGHCVAGGRRMALAGARALRARATCWLRCPPADVDFIQLSKIRGAANGKLETSRGRKTSAQELYGALRACRRKEIFG